MNYEKSKVLLKKINALHEAMSHGEGSNSLERDLFLQYIRTLYEVMSDTSTSSSDQNESIAAPISITPAPKPVVETRNPTAPMVASPQHSQPVVEEAKEVIATEKKDEISKELQELYAESNESFDSSRILGGKISDIGKSMGINEKILTINELFGGQQPLFDETIALLNKADNFEEAKKILAAGVAQDKEWINPPRRGKAIHFIHLVRRKYSN